MSERGLVKPILRRVLDAVRMVLSLLLASERKQLAGLALLMGFGGLMEVCSVLSVVPFLSVASRPEVIFENDLLNWLYESLRFDSTRNFLMFGGAMVVAVILLTSGLQALIVFVQLKFSGAVNTSVATRLFSGYLAQPYSFYVQRNSAELQACVQAESVYVQSAILQPMLQIVQKTISIFLLLGAVVVADPIVALVGLLVCSSLYGMVFLIVRRRLARLGGAIGPANIERFRALHEAFATPKLTKLMHIEEFFGERFARGTSTVNDAQSRQQMLSQLPRFALEAMAFGGIMILAIVLIATSKDFSEVIPLLGFYAFSGYRLMPAIQLVYSAVARLQFGWSRLVSIHKEFESIKPKDSQTSDESANCDIGRVEGAPILEVRDLSFSYEGTSEPTLRNISLRIDADMTVGICGTTGAGKTTLLDILLGLLSPSAGELRVDGVLINKENQESWQRQIGYVPQEIVLTDESIAHNIAFGVATSEIDLDAVRTAARLAGIADFIESSLPDKYDAMVGERGGWLSGGQRQRIGIARALYRKPRLLVFDEATSSLDTDTERTVMNAISDLAHQVTIVMVAHRINTLAPCSTVFRLDAGQVVQSGCFEDLFGKKPRQGDAEESPSAVD